MKKIIAMLIACLIIVGMFAGCSQQKDTETKAPDKEQTSETQKNNDEKEENKEDVTISIAALASAYMETDPEMWNKVAAAFTEETGINVKVTTDKKLEDVIGPDIKAGNYPDFVHLAAGREAALTESFIKDQALEDVTDVLSMKIPGEDITVGEKMSKGFTDSATTNPYGDGKTYLAPMFYSPCGLFYNAGLLEEKGWTVPATWDEMWELGDKAAEEGIALFCYPTTGYLQEFTFALIYAVGGADFFDSVVNYEEGVWETENGKQVLDILAKLATYTAEVVPAQANNQDFTKNQQLILDNKAIFIPNGTWVVGEMAEAPRAEGFKWGFTALPAVTAGGDRYSFAWFEQAWIPASAEHIDEAKQFMAFMYSDAAAEIFAQAGAIQPIVGLAETLEGDNAMFYSVYDNGAKAALGGWAATEAVEGVSMMDTLFGSMNSLVEGTLTEEEWAAQVIEVNDALRAAKI